MVIVPQRLTWADQDTVKIISLSVMKAYCLFHMGIQDSGCERLPELPRAFDVVGMQVNGRGRDGRMAKIVAHGASSTPLPSEHLDYLARLGLAASGGIRPGLPNEIPSADDAPARGRLRVFLT